jgi:hypothetical protein
LDIERLLITIAETRWSTDLRESLYAWPLVESTHVLTLAVFGGLAILLDLRLLGSVMRGVPASDFTARVLPWTRRAFAVMVLTGSLLFFASPVRNYHNVFFRVKMLLIVIAAINIWVFHSRTHSTVGEWDVARVPPRAARVAAVVSLVAWAGVIAAGRLIAYNWFDCDIQPQPAWVNRMADCPLLGPEAR